MPMDNVIWVSLIFSLCIVTFALTMFYAHIIYSQEYLAMATEMNVQSHNSTNKIESYCLNFCASMLCKKYEIATWSIKLWKSRYESPYNTEKCRKINRDLGKNMVDMYV